MYILQRFPDVLGDQSDWGDTSISLEVCRCLQYIPVVVLIQQARRRKKPGENGLELLPAELEASATLTASLQPTDLCSR